MADRIAANFARFHADNPVIYALFDRFAREMMDRRGHGSASLIFERMRWELMISTGMQSPRLNNNYRALYARLWEERNPDHAGFFFKRRRRSHSVDSTAFDEAE